MIADCGVDSSEGEQPAEEEEEATEVSKWDKSRDPADWLPLDLKLTNQASQRERDDRFTCDITISPWNPQNAPTGSAAPSPPAAAAAAPESTPDGNCLLCQESVVPADASQWNHCMCTAWYHTACREETERRVGVYGVHQCPSCSLMAASGVGFHRISAASSTFSAPSTRSLASPGRRRSLTATRPRVWLKHTASGSLVALCRTCMSCKQTCWAQRR
jgi:hypothetical protein